jgi:heme/copper-type cytochrome/quinol oxidase subunit 2
MAKIIEIHPDLIFLIINFLVVIFILYYRVSEQKARNTWSGQNSFLSDNELTVPIVLLND